MRYPNISNRAVVGGPITITSFRVFARGYILMERRAARGDWRRCAPVGRDGCRGGGPGVLRVEVEVRGHDGRALHEGAGIGKMIEQPAAEHRVEFTVRR